MEAPSNFDFLRGVPAGLYESAVRVERYAESDPRASAFYARFTLESAVRWLAENDTRVSWRDVPVGDEPRDSLGRVLHRMRVEGVTSREVHQVLVRVKRHGDSAVHDADFDDGRAVDAAEGLHRVLGWVAVRVGWIDRAVAFVRDLVRPAPARSPLSWADVEALERKLESATAERDRLAADQEVQDAWTNGVLADLDRAREELAEAKAEIARLEDEVLRLEVEADGLRDDLARSVPRRDLDALRARLAEREAVYRQLLAGAGLTSTRAFYRKGVLDFDNLLTIAEDDERPDERDEAAAVVLERLVERLDARLRPPAHE